MNQQRNESRFDAIECCVVNGGGGSMDTQTGTGLPRSLMTGAARGGVANRRRMVQAKHSAAWRVALPSAAMVTAVVIECAAANDVDVGLVAEEKVGKQAGVGGEALLEGKLG